MVRPGDAVSHVERRVTAAVRTGSGWKGREHRAGETIRLDGPEVAIDVDAIYEGIALDAV
ncbi:MAG: hypothetical protein H5U40_12460 [Polyangiaceae bacterium]|nr:hypothetical protein [Polyangiaceae bacterium]